MSRRPRTAVIASLAVVAGLTGAFAVGARVGDGTPPQPRVVGGELRGTDVVTAAYSGTDLAPATSCSDLLDWYVERGVDRVGPWGWGGGPVSYEGDVPFSSSSDGSASTPLAATPTTVRQTNEATGTNVQESGVDEPDSVKTDGSVLYRVDGTDLTTYDVTGAAVERLGSVDLPRMQDAEILLAGTTVVAIAQGYRTPDDQGTRMAVVDVSDPADPEVLHVYDYDTTLVTARLHDDTVRLVLQSGLPDLDFAAPGEKHWYVFGGGDDDDATRTNRELVEASTIDDWLPHVSVDGGDPELLLGCDQVGLPDDEAGLGTIAVVGFDVATEPQDTDAADADVTGLAVDTGIAYASSERLYLATSSVTAGWSECFDCGRRSGPQVASVTDDGRSRLYSFALDGTRTTYVASGRVDGTVRDRWSLDEAGGVLRVAVGASVSTGDANAVVTMEEDGDDLVELGRVDGLGPDEDIQSVRWFDDLALVVTFRQTDPLYAVDLADPASPRLLGELKIPGFSAYLHPLGSDRLIGLGEGPDSAGRGWGAQMGLFDVTDLTQPQRIALTHYGADTYAPATSDPRQFTWLPDERTVLTVIGDYRRGQTGYVSVVHLADGAMTNRMVEVEHGSEVSAVRLVPLPDGRVVLVTGDDASFFDTSA